jgi:hypothetical protein
MILWAFYIGLPAFLLIILSWFSYGFTKRVCFDEFWMMPLLICLSTFVAGVIIRQGMRYTKHQLGLTVLAGLGLMVFAVLVWMDIQNHQLISPYLPLPLRSEVLPYVYAIPLVGLLGLVFSNLFAPYEV